MGEHQANGAAAEAQQKRRGRPAGSKNRATLAARELFQKPAAKTARKVLARLDRELERGDAANLNFVTRMSELIFAYAWGRPIATQEVSGPEGGAIEQRIDTPQLAHRRAQLANEVEFARSVAFLMEKGTRAAKELSEHP